MTETLLGRTATNNNIHARVMLNAQVNQIEKRGELRLARELPIRRLNVDIGGLVIHTSNVSRNGAQLVCPAMRFPTLKKILGDTDVSCAIELPTRRIINADIDIKYACPCDDEYLIGVEFIQFVDGDAAGWYAYIDWIGDSRRAVIT